MLVFDYFAGDDNEQLKNIQHDMYSGHLFEFYKPAKDAFYFACHATGNLDDDYKKVLDAEFIDHRRVQYSHDYVAAKYRYENLHTQLSLFPEEDNQSNLKYIGLWHPELMKYTEGLGAYHILNWRSYMRRVGTELAEIPAYVNATMNNLFLQDDFTVASKYEQEMITIVENYLLATIRPKGKDGPFLEFGEGYNRNLTYAESWTNSDEDDD